MFDRPVFLNLGVACRDLFEGYQLIIKGRLHMVITHMREYKKYM